MISLRKRLLDSARAKRSQERGIATCASTCAECVKPCGSDPTNCLRTNAQNKTVVNAQANDLELGLSALRRVVRPRGSLAGPGAGV